MLETASLEINVKLLKAIYECLEFHIPDGTEWEVKLKTAQIPLQNRGPRQSHCSFHLLKILSPNYI